MAHKSCQIYVDSEMKFYKSDQKYHWNEGKQRKWGIIEWVKKEIRHIFLHKNERKEKYQS